MYNTKGRKIIQWYMAIKSFAPYTEISDLDAKNNL